MINDSGIVIIGGGFSGLASAYFLKKMGMDALLLEKNHSLGGMASCVKTGGFLIEKFYHHFFSHDSDILSIIRDIGKENELIWGKTSMGFFAGNNIYGLTTPFDLLRFRHISMLDRLSFSLFSYNARKSSAGVDLDGISTEEWLGNKIGSSAYLRIMAPLIRSKFGVHMNDISAAFLMGRVKARVNSRTKLFGKEKFGYLSGGLDRLSSGMINILEKEGRMVRLGCEAKKIRVKGDYSFSVETSDGSALDCGHIIFTAPLPVLRSLLSSSGGTSCFPEFDYRSVVCACIGLRKSLSKYYWINIAAEELPFGIIIEHTNLVPPSEYKGDHIIYLASYCDRGSNIFRMSDESLLDVYASGLKKIFPSFNNNDILWSMISREPFASPVFRRNFSRDLDILRSSLPKGLHLAGNLLTYPGSRNVNSVARTGKNAAVKVMEEYENK
ncbi:MAG: FAD-dependent oxidoreductase [Nitrospirae bacterium]|nr:FAD-dependent oxidoreductase [Nitrospirota bacterium]